jgi:hypothetical protein
MVTAFLAAARGAWSWPLLGGQSITWIVAAISRGRADLVYWGPNKTFWWRLGSHIPGGKTAWTAVVTAAPGAWTDMVRVRMV